MTHLRKELRRAGRTTLQILHPDPQNCHRPGSRKERGVALLMVLLFVVMIGVLAQRQRVESFAGIVAAHNAEAEVHAYFHARSSLEIARLVIISQTVANQYLNLAKSMMPGLNSPKLELWAYACKFAEIFNSGKVEMFGTPLFDLEGQDGIGVVEGEFSCVAEAEDGRININQVGTKEEKQMLYFRLFPLMRSLKGVDEAKDRDVIDQVLNIIDYADADEMACDVAPNGMLTEEGGGAEGSNYMGVEHEPKNAFYDSVEELRMVPGMDDETFCQLKDRVTVYLTQKLNVNSADLYVLRALICENLIEPAEQQMCKESIVGMPGGHPVDLALEWLAVCRKLKWSLFTPPFATPQAFSSFFKRLPIPLNTELRVNTAGLQRHVSTDSKVIRLRGTGRYRNITKTIDAVVDSATGRYIYWREN